MNNAGQRLSREEKVYLLISYAQLAATVTMVLGGFIVLLFLMASSGLL